MRVLVVDDSSTLRSLLRLHLMRIPNREVVLAENGQDALMSIRKLGPPDLILLDINMPVMNGLEFMKMRESLGVSAAIPVILVTTEGKEEDVRRGLAAGARGYVSKPFTAQQLESVIAEVMSGLTMAPPPGGAQSVGAVLPGAPGKGGG
jgi:two-component system chemotaxis response regulator CheY